MMLASNPGCLLKSHNKMFLDHNHVTEHSDKYIIKVYSNSLSDWTKCSPFWVSEKKSSFTILFFLFLAVEKLGKIQTI